MKIKKILKIFDLFLLCFIIIGLSSCAFIKKSSNRKQIVTTLYPEYDMVMKIIGNNKETKGLFDVTLIIPPGQDSHTYDPSISDLITIKSADLFIYTADEMETWVKDLEFNENTKVLNLSSDKRIELVKAEEEDAHLSDANHTDIENGHEHTHVHEYDPHYWVYPIYAMYMVEQIEIALINLSASVDSHQEQPIRTALINNAKNYRDELEEIDKEIIEITKNAKTKTMYFGSPFSFYYWHIHYGLDYKLTYSTCSTETEPPIEVLISIINEMKENNIDVIFAKELLNQEACEMIRFHTGAKILVMHSGHNVSVEDFNNSEMSYLTILRNDVANLRELLKVENR